MDYQFASTYSLIIIMFMHALLLLLRFEKENRSRFFMAIVFLSFGSLMLFQFAYTYILNEVEQIESSVKTLFVIAFLCSINTVYPIEVVRPKSVNAWKVLRLNMPLITLLVISLIAYINGYNFKSYNSIISLFYNLIHFDAIVSILLLLCIGVYLAYTIYLLVTCRNEQIDSQWSSKYLVTFIVMNLFYVLSTTSNAELHMFCRYIFVLCCTYITYLELFERIGTNAIKQNVSVEQLANNQVKKARVKDLKDRLIEYMEQEKSWRDPNITVQDVIIQLGTNRRALNAVIRDLGYDNFPSYINYLRVREFTKIIEKTKEDSFQNIFYIVGFKSRITAHRNFKNIKGLSPSKYYQSIQ